MEPDEKTKEDRSSMPRQGPVAMLGGGDKAKDLRGSITKLVVYLKDFKYSFLAVSLFAVLGTVFAIVSPKMLGNITNQVVDDVIKMSVYDQVVIQIPEGVTLPPGTTGSDFIDQLPEGIAEKLPEDKLQQIRDLDLTVRPTIDFETILQIVVILIGLYVFSSLFTYLQQWIMARVSQLVTFRMRAEVTQKINQLPLKYFDNNTFGDVLSRVTNDIDTVGQTLNQSLSQVVTSIILLFGIIVMMLSISWELTIVAILVLPISMLFIGLIVKNSQSQFKKQQDSLGDINGHIEESYGAHTIIRAYNGEQAAIDKFNKINDKLYDSGWKSQFLSGLMMPIMRFISNLGYVAVAVVGGWLAVNGKLKIGDIQAFIQYLQQFSQPVMQAANIVNVLQSTAAAAERVFEFLEEEEEVAEAENPIKLEKIRGGVEFDHVVFGYEKDKTIIKDFNVSVEPGQRIAIVGPTGAGKTTIVNLLMRFYDVNSGSIKVDGVNVKDMLRSDLRGLFGMVLQDTWLFNGSIRDNIVYGRLNATEAEIKAAANAAQVDHFVHSLPGGYNMELNESTDNVSQGEKQLLTIARAMLADPPILILDEATSSVDTRTEVLIQRAMDHLMEGRTSFVIAHRLSTIRNADVILVMDHGSIVERGDHEELMELNGFYEELYSSQFAGQE